MTFKKTILTSALTLCALQSFACTTILVGKKATVDGSIMIARNDDFVGGDAAVHFLRHTNTVGGYTYQSPANKFSYVMPKHVFAYTGIPDWDTHDNAMEEAGLNQVGAAISATETIFSNKQTLAVDPYLDKTGITEDAIPSVILPQIKTAREGVEILGHIIETQGSGEGFGVTFADKNEVWYLENAGGHEWVAEKLPDDSYFVSGNQGRLGQVNLSDSENYLSSPNLVQYATQHDLYHPNDGDFNFSKVFSRDDAIDLSVNKMRVWTLQKLYTPSLRQSFKFGDYPVFLKPDHLLSLEDVKAGLANRFQGSENDPYATQNPNTPYRPIAVFRGQQSHIIQLRSNLPLPIANIEYLAMGMQALSAYIPFYQGVTKIPQAYDVGTNQADNISAFWRFRKLQTLAMLNYPKYAPIVQSAYAKFSADTAAKQTAMEKQYLKNPAQGQKLLNQFTQQTVDQAFALTDALTNQLFTLESNAIADEYKFVKKD